MMPETAKPPLPPCDVLIAGGGLAGLALALALRQGSAGTLSVRLHDPAFARPPGRRAFAIAAGTRRMLEILGVWDEVATAAQPLTAMDITDSALDEPVRPLFLSFEGEVEPGEPFAHMVEEGPLSAALQAAAERAGAVFSPIAVRSFRTERETIAIEAADGSSVAARLLVAADGARSRLREIAGISFYGWSYDQSAIVGTIRHERPHEGRAVEHFLPAGPFALLPLRGDRSSIVWTERRSAADAILRRDPEVLAAMIEKRFGLELGRITLEGRCTPIRCRWASRGASSASGWRCSATPRM